MNCPGSFASMAPNKRLIFFNNRPIFLPSNHFLTFSQKMRGKEFYIGVKKIKVICKQKTIEKNKTKFCTN